MKRTHFIILIIIISGVIQMKCDNPDAFDCVKKAGEQVEEEVLLDPFENIYLKDDINLHIEYGERQKVILKTGKNLIPKIDFTIKDNNLTITNNNSCKWARNYNTVTVHIVTDHLIEIESQGYGTIESVNTLLFESLILESKDGSGDFFITVNNKKLQVVNNSHANVFVKGSTDQLTVEHYYSFGKFEGESLLAKNVAVWHHGVNDITIYSDNAISGLLNSRGNIFYYGNPLNIDIEIKGSGKLINLN